MSWYRVGGARQSLCGKGRPGLEDIRRRQECWRKQWEVGMYGRSRRRCALRLAGAGAAKSLPGWVAIDPRSLARVG